MNKEMTIYELLGLVKDNKAPKKIIFDDTEYYLTPAGCYVRESDGITRLLTQDYNLLFCLNDKVEILEDKDIKLLDVALLSQSDNWLWCPSKDDFEKDIELNAYIIENIRENTLNFQRKLNEVIKEVNKLRKEEKTHINSFKFYDRDEIKDYR